ncbi:MAG TPA: hypothetical protein VN782_09795 [Usitatibacter sp.]|nr:hypothetical protein [Usitatibacter sp.]
MKAPLALTLLLLAGACAATGPYARPYSIIEDDPIQSADPNVIHVLVNRVDDRNATDIHHAVVPPGRHEVTVDVGRRKGWQPTQRTFSLTTEPCRRYYVSARLANRAGPEWTPVVRSSDRIAECEAKFAMNAR